MSRVVAFAKDWEDVPTCITHVLKEMGKTMPVLWVSSIGTRRPNLAQPGDARRIVQRITRGLSRAALKQNHLRVMNPLLIPKAQSGVARAINRILFGWLAGRELRVMAAERGDSDVVEYWCSVPNAVDYLPATADGNKVIYYCPDDWSEFGNLDGEWLASKERLMLQRADVVFTPSIELKKKLSEVAGDNVHHVPHGVDYEKFSSALSDEMAVPEELASLAGPVVGFYGNIYPWIDFDLVGRLAERFPEWNFVLIGGAFCDVRDLEKLANVYLLGRREHDALPAYCKGFDAAIVPYDMKKRRMQTVNPVKVREMLAAGVPVVAAKLPELVETEVGREGDVITCGSDEEWVQALERQVVRSDRREISQGVMGDGWGGRVAWMREVVDGS